MLDADYLVVGAGASGLAFTDALVSYTDATVAIVDRRGDPGGHWCDAYPFVRLHQASAFYGVASMLLGGGRRQSAGPEAGLHERASGAEVRAYCSTVLDTLVATGRVAYVGGYEHVGAGMMRRLDDAGAASVRVRPGARIVDARFLSPTIPATSPPPFEVAADTTVLPVGRLDACLDASRLVIVGSGKTATDAVVHALGAGVDPGRITWVRPREPWMLDRAVAQPDPAVFTGMAAAVWESAARARSLEELFARLEDAGVMLRIDRAVTPTMAKTPTLARWELALLREVEDVARLGHLRRVERRGLSFEDGDVPLPPGAAVVHCAADGLPRPAPVPVWTTDAITLQPIRAGFPCFGAALIGYVEATRSDDHAKNALCPPTSYGDTRAQWAEMTVRGARSVAAYSREPDIRAWAREVHLNPARVPQGYASRAWDEARERIARADAAATRRLAELAGIAP